jgi:hypothetical protein
MKKIRVNPCSSVVNFSLCLGAFVAEIQSIKTTKLCETNPISQTHKMVVTAVMTMTNNKKQRTANFEKQTQFKPNQTQWIITALRSASPFIPVRYVAFWQFP